MTLFHVCPYCHESNPVDFSETKRLRSQIEYYNLYPFVVVHIDYYCPHCNYFINETLS